MIDILVVEQHCQVALDRSELAEEERYKERHHRGPSLACSVERELDSGCGRLQRLGSAREGDQMIGIGKSVEVELSDREECMAEFDEDRRLVGRGGRVGVDESLLTDNRAHRQLTARGKTTRQLPRLKTHDSLKERDHILLSVEGDVSVEVRGGHDEERLGHQTPPLERRPVALADHRFEHLDGEVSESRRRLKLHGRRMRGEDEGTLKGEVVVRRQTSGTKEAGC